MGKNLRLDARAEMEEVHDLGQAGTSDSAEAGEFGLGRDGVGAYEFVEVDGEGEEFCCARQSADWGRWWQTAGSDATATVAAAGDGEGFRDCGYRGLGFIHGHWWSPTGQAC